MLPDTGRGGAATSEDLRRSIALAVAALGLAVIAVGVTRRYI
jgi:hypothetical protein